MLFSQIYRRTLSKTHASNKRRYRISIIRPIDILLCLKPNLKAECTGCCVCNQFSSLVVGLPMSFLFCAKSQTLFWASDINFIGIKLHEAFVVAARNRAIDVSQARFRWHAYTVWLGWSGEQSRRIELKDMLGQSEDARQATTDQSMSDLCGNQVLWICEIPCFR